MNKNKVIPGFILRSFSFSQSLQKKREIEKEKGLGIDPGMPLFLFKKVGHKIGKGERKLRFMYLNEINRGPATVLIELILKNRMG